MSDLIDSENIVLACQGLQKIYRQGVGEGSEVPVLLGVNMQIVAGERVAVVGASGSGKSTLLGILAGLDTPSSGQVRLAGVDLFSLDEDARAAVRGEKVGFVF